MDRKIVFRGKKSAPIDSSEKWVYGNIEYKDLNTIIKESNGNSYLVNLGTVGQFTTFKDSKENDIYEGDIVKAPLLDPIFGDVLKDAFCNAIIKFNNGAFVVSYYNGTHNIYLQDLHDLVTVIGNICDNPELLKD